MKNLKVVQIDYSNRSQRDWTKVEDRLNELIVDSRKHLPSDQQFRVQLVNINESKSKPEKLISWEAEPIRLISEKSGDFKNYVMVNRPWFYSTILPVAKDNQADIAIVHDNEYDWYKSSGGSSVQSAAAWYFGIRDGIGCIAIASDENEPRSVYKNSINVDEWIARFIHEMGHCYFKAIFNGRDITHELDYNQDNLLAVLKVMDIKKFLAALSVTIVNDSTVIEDKKPVLDVGTIQEQKNKEVLKEAKIVSRNPADMHLLLRERYDYCMREWDLRYKHLGTPYLTCTFRSKAAQDEAYANGFSNAQWGQSLHNYDPCYAFDIAFKTNKVNPDWTLSLFDKFNSIAREAGLVWGADWDNDGIVREPGEFDSPHWQLPMTWQDAKATRVPVMPPLPGTVVQPPEITREEAAKQIAQWEQSKIAKVLLLLANYFSKTNK